MKKSAFIILKPISFFLSICFLLLVFSCSQKGKTRFDKQLAKETAIGKRYDSLFFNFYFGMPTKDFYDYCWTMNKQGKFMDGLGNTMVSYKLDSTQLGYNANMFFFPIFSQNKISAMQMLFDYDAWAPWNRHLFADSLLIRVADMFLTWYGGNSFHKQLDTANGTMYKKIDGNRYIEIHKPLLDDKTITVLIKDMTVKEAE